MTRLREKKGNKIQLTLPPRLYNDWKAVKQEAASLGFRVSMKDDFEKWFSGELAQIQADLKRHKESGKDSNKSRP